ncbi:MAG: pyridoxamine 5'-phosphate oxidase family protein [Candidatus Hodarchaeales archaeon]|jgi:nitroimidazol reductase NimA-like FMN-containing flavoprotein (pyridoxamine 5'-phosphate oxidase superfamily)
MKDIRRKEKAIHELSEMKRILQKAHYITIAMSKDNEPYLVTLSHGYDPDTNAIYFHCAQEGKKIEFLKSNNLIWGQAVIDKGYVQGACDHLYLTIQFKGRVTFLENLDEKKKALVNMIKKLDKNPQKVISRQLKETSIKKVKIGRIDVEYMSGKKSKDVVISL